MRFAITMYTMGGPGQRHFRTAWLMGSGTRLHCRSAPPISCSTSTATGMSWPFFCDCVLEIEQWGREKTNHLQALLGNKKRDPRSHLTYQMGHCCCCCCYVTSVVSNSVRPHRQQPTRLPCPWDSPGKNTGVGCHFLLQCIKVKSESEVAQSCLTLRDPMDCSPPGSSMHGIFQARVLRCPGMTNCNMLRKQFIKMKPYAVIRKKCMKG